jgi:agmatine/peptidylarginine deiminase
MAGGRAGDRDGGSISAMWDRQGVACVSWRWRGWGGPVQDVGSLHKVPGAGA